MIDLIVFVADLHCGSTMGLMPPCVPTAEGNMVCANPAQVWLWKQWQHATGEWLEAVTAGREWGLVINGDSIEGRHHSTMQLVHTDIEVHLGIASRVLSPLAAKAHRTYFVRGTECHARTLESQLGERLGAEKDPTTDDYCWEQLQLRVNGVLTHVKHHTSSGMRPWTRGGTIAKALAAEQLTAIQQGHEPPRVVVRAHAHYYDAYEGVGGLAILLPPWQMMTRYARAVTQASLSTPGIVAIDYAGGTPKPIVQLYRPDPDPVVTP